MKRHFVLDENILILAQKRENDRGEPDDACLRLLLAIVENCHALVIAHQFGGWYLGQLNRVARESLLLVPGVPAILKAMLNNSRKDHRFLDDHELPAIPGLAQHSGVDAHDCEFVRAAAAVTGSVLVTTDGPLIDAILREGLAQMYGFLVCRPADAARLAGPDG